MEEGNDSEENERTLMENENDMVEDANSGNGITFELFMMEKCFYKKMECVIV